MDTESASNVITIELPPGLLADLATTSQTIGDALRLAAAIEWYREGRISQGRGAEVAGLTRADFLDALARAKVSACQVDFDELMEEVDLAIPADRRRLTADLAGEGEPA